MTGYLVAVYKRSMAYKAGKPQKERPERNEALIADYSDFEWKLGSRKQEIKVYRYSMAQLMRKYEISDTRIYEILDKYNTPRREKPRRKKEEEEVENG